MQPLGHFLFVALAVQLRKPLEYFDASCLRNGKADAIALWQIGHFMEAVIEIKVVPTVGVGDSRVHLALQRAQLFDARITLGVGMKTVIELGQTDAVCSHHVNSSLVESTSQVIQWPVWCVMEASREGERFECIRWAVSQVVLQS